MARFKLNPFRKTPPVVVVLSLHGAIGVQSRRGRALDLARLEPLLTQAFAVKGAKAVAINVNSPGGSPVQSALIHDRIRALAEEKKLPVHMFAEDVAASGGYMLLLAGDDIHAHPASIIGSIGVVYGGFGFAEAIRRLGIERRLHTAGARKGMLDPFLPENPDDVARLKVIQAQVHDFFKGMVEARRGGKLKGDPAELYSGDVWLGQRALDLGLVDGLGDLRSVMREKYGKKTQFKVLGRERNLLRGLFGLHGRDRASLAEDVLATMETRALWSRFGQ